MVLMAFFFSATVSSCGNKKTDDTEESAEHPEEEHPEGNSEAEDEHPSDGDEHPE